MRIAQRLVPFLLAGAAILIARAPLLIEAAPLESTMGVIQKIFYFHVPSAAATFLGAFVCGGASAMFLWRRGRVADSVAVSAAELVVLFGFIVLFTGPLWARKAWGIWWDWQDVRLTTTLIMWMVFVAYLLLRRFGGPGSEILAAAAGVFGAALVPFVYVSAYYWNKMHPKPDVARTLPPEMLFPLLWSLAGFGLLFAALLIVRTQLELARHRLEEAYAGLDD
jgi:heme exporter protein C